MIGKTLVAILLVAILKSPTSTLIYHGKVHHLSSQLCPEADLSRACRRVSLWLLFGRSVDQTWVDILSEVGALSSRRVQSLIIHIVGHR